MIKKQVIRTEISTRQEKAPHQRILMRDFFALCFPAPGCPAGQHQACLGDREAHLLGAYCSAETGDDFYAYHVGKDCGRQSGGIGVNQKEQGLV